MREDPDYLKRHLITYIGNKRSRLDDIDSLLRVVKEKLGRDKLSIFDVFSGSGIVSRFFKSHASHLTVNDIEDYARVLSCCYLANPSDVDFMQLNQAIDSLNNEVAIADMPMGFIRELYAPSDKNNIKKNERVFYTPDNARRIDDYRRLIDTYPADMFDFLIAPLVVQSSIHVNTAGVFKGFYKNKGSGIGQFGGTGSDALKRILGKIELDLPIFSNTECEYEVFQGDANEVARRCVGIDLAYLDPPYNQHPYGSNYFMLNLIVNYERPRTISKVSGIPTNWRRSGYNVRATAPVLLQNLIELLDAKFVMISFNSEGFISLNDMKSILGSLGKFELMETKYNAFRGSRNLGNRPIHVTEQLFLLEKN